VEGLVYVSVASIIGFFVIVIILGCLLHFALSKTRMYKRKVQGKGVFSKIVYFVILLVMLYILLLVIFGVINLIGF
jgi:hypothetical protein